MKSRIPNSSVTSRTLVESSHNFKYDHVCEHNKPQFKEEQVFRFEKNTLQAPSKLGIKYRRNIPLDLKTI